jgi:CheY-like chemotaxis protein
MPDPAAAHGVLEPKEVVLKSVDNPPCTRVLVVENDSRLRLDLAVRLGRQYDVTAVASAREALDLVSFGAVFDVVLCELKMPETSGVDFCRHLGEIEPRLASRVVLMFDLGLDPHLRNALETLPNPRIARPFEEEALIAVLEALGRPDDPPELEPVPLIAPARVDAATVFALAVRLTRGEVLALLDRDGSPWQASATTLVPEREPDDPRAIAQGCAADIALEIVRRGLRTRGRRMLASGA